MKIFHIINSMANGGAESVLYRIIKNDLKNEHIILLLIDDNFYKNQLIKNDIIFYSINKKLNFLWFLKLILIPYFIYKHNPQVVQTWMYHSNLLISFLSIFFFKKKIYWNIRHSNFSDKISIKYKIILKLSSLFSKIIPKSIIYCSNSSKNFHESIGFDKKKSILIENGYIDISLKINNDYKKIFLKRFNIPNNEIIFGNVSRWNIQKNHELLFKSLNILKNKFHITKFRLILIGKNISENNEELNGLVNKYDLKENIIILEPTLNIHNIYSLFDISLLSSSFGEGFSNFLSESMMCSIPCVSTDIGDSSLIISNYGVIVPPNRDIDFSRGIMKLLDIRKNAQEWDKLKKNNQKHIFNNFSIESMLYKYNSVWNEN